MKEFGDEVRLISKTPEGFGTSRVLADVYRDDDTFYLDIICGSSSKEFEFSNLSRALATLKRYEKDYIDGFPVIEWEREDALSNCN